MASASAVPKETGEDELLECGICKQRYTNPKILGCVHSFCEQCLIEYYGNDQTKPCPLCHQETKLPVPGGVGCLRTNGFLIKLKDKVELWEKVAITSGKARRVCELCAKKEVTHHCLNRSQNICQKCMKIHQRSKASADHKVGTLEDIREREFVFPEEKNEYRCNQHKGKINRFYCETCRVSICRECTVVDHCKPEHQYTDRAAAASKYKQVLKEILPPCNKEIAHLDRRLEDLSSAQREFKTNVSKTKRRVKKSADQLRAKVQEEEDRILREIKTLENDRKTAFLEHKKTLESWRQRNQHTLTIATDITTNSADSDFLSLFPIIKDELSFLRKQVPPRVDGKLRHLCLCQSPVTIELGELHLGDEWKLLSEVDLDGNPSWDVAALQGDKLVLSLTGKCPKLFVINTAGEIVETIQTGWEFVAAVAVSGNQIVVSDGYRVQMYKEDFTLANQFTTSSPRKARGKRKGNRSRVSVKKDGSLLVGDVNRNVLTIHSPDGSSTRAIPVVSTPRFLTTDSNDRVVVSGNDDNQVTVIDDYGATLVTIRPTINGRPVRACRGVCCDGSEIYIAVVSKKRKVTCHIHRYDGDGKFLSCVLQDLRGPQGITLTEDGQHLAVVDLDKVKIYCRIYQSL